MKDREILDKKLYKLEVFGLRPKMIYLNMFTDMEGLEFNSPHNDKIWSYKGIDVLFIEEEIEEPIVDFEI